MNKIMSAAERRDACQDTVYLTDHEWDYAQWLHILTMESLEHVEGLMGADVASGPLRQLVQPVANINCIDADTWRDAMEDVSAFFDVLPISSRFYEAVLYGLYGVTPEKVPVGDRAGWLGALVTEMFRSLAAETILCCALPASPHLGTRSISVGEKWTFILWRSLLALLRGVFATFFQGRITYWSGALTEASWQ